MISTGDIVLIVVVSLIILGLGVFAIWYFVLRKPSPVPAPSGGVTPQPTPQPTPSPQPVTFNFMIQGADGGLADRNILTKVTSSGEVEMSAAALSAPGSTFSYSDGHLSVKSGDCLCLVDSGTGMLSSSDCCTASVGDTINGAKVIAVEPTYQNVYWCYENNYCLSELQTGAIGFSPTYVSGMTTAWSNIPV